MKIEITPERGVKLCCSVEGCTNQSISRGMCGTHYTRYKRHGDPNTRLTASKDGRREHDLYDVHYTMIYRCTKPNHKSYPRYGGIGIKVCERWLNKEDGFWNFVEDMGERSPDQTIDRIDGDGNYEPNNCRWATLRQQALNKKSNKNSVSKEPYINWRGDSKKWRVVFTFEGKKIRCGSYINKEEAIKVRDIALLEYGININDIK